MEYSIKEDKINTVLTSVNLETKIDGGNIEVVMGDGAKINTNDALTYIKSGEVEIEKAVNAGKIVVGQEVHKANIWAEGTDAEVQALGGEHSAKGWAEESKDPMKWGNISGTLSNQTDLQNALNEKQDTLTFDNTPTQNSDNPVKSGGVYTSLSGKQNTLTFDDTPTQSSNNPVKSGGIYTALSGKQNTLTFDNTPTENSDNPVKSGGVYTSLTGKAGLSDNNAFTGTNTFVTQANSDNSTKAATTEYVNNKFVEVNALPATPDPDTWYAIPEV